MAIRAGDLVEPRHLERLRTEIIEVISAGLAYPPFFDFRLDSLRARPIDREKVAEIEQFIGSANFATIERIPPSSPDVRRLVERLMLRYLEVNPAMATPAGRRYLGSLRAQAARLATETQRRFTNHVNGQERDFGIRRQAPSWATAKRNAKPSLQRAEHSNRLLEAGLKEPSSARVASAKRAAVTPGSGAASSAKTAKTAQAAQSSAGIFGPFVSSGPSAAPAVPSIPPIPPLNPHEPDSHGQRRPSDLADQPTGPVAAIMPVLPAYGKAAVPEDGVGQQMRELPADLLNLYGAYLGDMEPEARGSATNATPPRPAPPPTPAPPASSPTARAVSTAGRNDILIFYQLRYQVEAYVRLAARSYGLPGHNGDPASVLDDLRRSGFVDEADLRIAEGVFALADRVTSQGQATLEDYRQAMMLYLLYHRSHLPS